MTEKTHLELTTPRCVLRPLTADDAPQLHELWTSPGVRRFLWDDEIIPRTQTDEALALSARLFHEQRAGLWGVWPGKSRTLAGFAGLWPFRDPPEIELLYGIAEPLWGQGYAVEAAQAVMRYCFGTLDMPTVRASTDFANKASVRVLEKLGFLPTRRATAGGLDTLFFERRRP